MDWKAILLRWLADLLAELLKPKAGVAADPATQDAAAKGQAFVDALKALP